MQVRQACLLFALLAAVAANGLDGSTDGQLHNLDAEDHDSVMNVNLQDGKEEADTAAGKEKAGSTAQDKLAKDKADKADKNAKAGQTEKQEKPAADKSAKSGQPEQHNNSVEKEQAKSAHSIDMNNPLPLSLAGQSGYETKCTVHGNTVKVSGKSESACLFTSGLIKDQPFAVEIAFDVAFSAAIKGDSGRHGGIFYGARQNIDTRAGNPTIDWIDKKKGQGYRVYGNSDTNKVKDMSPGPNPNKRWQILLQPDGSASFTAGPKTWLKNFHPSIKGTYFGFYVAAGVTATFSNVVVRKVSPPKAVVPLQKGATGKTLKAQKGYGKGTAVLFYSAAGGSDGKVSSKSIYLKGTTLEPKDFRTRKVQGNGGDIGSSKDLVAGRFLKIKPSPGFRVRGRETSGSMFYIGEGRGNLQDKSLYISNGDFATQRGSIGASLNLIAGKRLSLSALNGFGSGTASFVYSNAGKNGKKSNTVYLQQGNVATQRGSVMGLDVTASEYLSIAAMQRYGDGEAQFWFSKKGNGRRIQPDTVYLKSGDLQTESGDVISARDIIVGRHLQIGAAQPYGNGAGKMFYIAEAGGKYKENSLYLSSSFSTEDGSLSASKNVISNRGVQIKAFPGFGNGVGQLWYCQRASKDDSAQSGIQDKSLYVTRGDFATQVGSIGSNIDLVANSMLVMKEDVKSLDVAAARLWYSHRGRGRLEGESLYLKRGSFATQEGNIGSSDSLITAKYAQVGAMTGFGNEDDKIQLWYSAKPQGGGTTLSTLYQKTGDLRLEKGSVHTTDLSSHGLISLQALPGHGSGTASLYYVDVPAEVTQRSKSLYLMGKVDFRSRNIFSAKHLITKSLVVHSKKGFGNGQAELWFGKAGGASGALNEKNLVPNTLYLRDGDFRTQRGGMTTELDLETKEGSLKVAPAKAFRIGTKITDFAELWYSSTGASGLASKSLYLKNGDFNTFGGSVKSARDIRAHGKVGSLKAWKAHIHKSLKCDRCNFGKIYILPRKQQIVKHSRASPSDNKPPVKPGTGGDKAVHTMPKEALVLLDEGSRKTPAIDLEVALTGLQKQHAQLKGEELRLTSMLDTAMQRLASMEALKR